MRERSATVRILRSADRFRTARDGIATRHCFAFGDHYDPENTGFADLVAVNDEYVEPGHGYDLHRHSAAEIVTWVLDGALEHKDSAGNAGTIGIGTIQRMSAGTGVQHAERNASTHRPVRFVQMWLRSDNPDAAPSYQHVDIAGRLQRSEFVAAVGEGAAIGIGTAAATLWVARLDATSVVPLPSAPLRHLHVVRGAVDIGGGEALEDGDTMRIDGGDGGSVVAQQPSELLLWTMHPSS